MRPATLSLVLALTGLLLAAGPTSGAVAAQEAPPAPVSASDITGGQPITPSSRATSPGTTASGPADASSGAAAPTRASSAPATDPNPLHHIDPKELLTLFSGLLGGLFADLVNGLRDGLITFINDSDLLRQTPPTWVQNNQAVQTLEPALRQLANAALALIVFWLGLGIATRPLLGGSGLGLNPLEDLPRLLFAVVLANSAHIWMPLAITTMNSLSLWV